MSILASFKAESRDTQVLLLGGSLLVIGLFFSRAFISIGGGLLALSFVLRLFSGGPKILLQPTTLIGLSVFALLAVSYFWMDEGAAYYSGLLQIKLGFLVVLLGMSGAAVKQKWLDLFLLLLVAGAFVIGLASTINYIIHYEELNEAVKRSKPIPIINGHWHISFSYMLAFSFFAGIHLFKKAAAFKNAKWYLLAATCLNAVFLHILTARTGLVAFYATVGFYLLWLIVVKQKWALGLTVFVLGTVGIFSAIRFIPSLNNRYHNTVIDMRNALKGGNANYRSGTMRIRAMQAGWLVFTENPWKGVGLGDLKPAIVQAYDDMDAQLLPENQILPHNQFVNFMATIGVFGLLLFLLFWLSPFQFYSSIQNPLLLLQFMVLSFTAMNLEALLERQIGTAFFTFFFLLLSTASRSKS